MNYGEAILKFQCNLIFIKVRVLISKYKGSLIHLSQNQIGKNQGCQNYY